jgi:diguanylate cyclase (GGDEF)-like protein
VGELFAQHRLAEALERAARAEQVSNTDALTGVLSRRWVQEELPVLLRARTRSELPVGVAIVDIDRFKLVNDRHGHDVGDEVLRGVAQQLVRCDGVEHVARLGGEEFLLVLLGPATTWEAVVDGVRSSLTALRWPRSAPDLTTTVSVGVAEVEPRTR